jgi:hypothetical protein
MIQVLENIVDTLERIREDMPALIAEVLEENASLIEDMNIAQLREGKRSDGSDLPDYSPVSVSKYGKRPGPMTLEDTGKFHRGITVRTNLAFAEIIGTDSKTGKLEALYGIDIVGVPLDRMDDLKFNILLPGLREKVRVKYFAK